MVTSEKRHIKAMGMSALKEHRVDNRNCRVSIYAEFISSLSVANVYVGFDEPSKTYSVTKITCDRQNIRVTVFSKAGPNRRQPNQQLKVKNGEDQDDDENSSAFANFVAKLPKGIHLLPNTCSVIQPTPHGWLLRINIAKEDEDNIIMKEELPASCIMQTDDVNAILPKCHACGNPLLLRDVTVSKMIPVSSFGLAPIMQWDHMAISYFCHNHQHQEDQEDPHVSACSPGTTHATSSILVPKPDEVFTDFTSFILNAKVIDPTKILLDYKTTNISCARCHLLLGNVVRDEIIQLFKDAVYVNDNSHGDNKLLGTFVLNCSQNSRRLCITLQGHHDNDMVLLLWIMDRNLKIFQARLRDGEEHNWDSNVLKVLYKQELVDSVLAKQWMNDTNVNRIEIHKNLLVLLISALLKSTSNLPLAWRYANDFCIGYLEI